METYIFVMFILYILGSGTKISQLSRNEYPRVEESTKGQDLFHLLVVTAFGIWTGFLIF